jgi:hypothetical protein
MQTHPFANIPAAPLAHLKLYCYAAVLRILDQLARTCGTLEAAIAQFSFLANYCQELGALGLAVAGEEMALDWWLRALHGWEAAATGHLPLRALREAAGLDDTALMLMMCVGLAEEDARFDQVFEAALGVSGQRRPTVGLLGAWWNEASGDAGARAGLRRLLALDLLQVVNPEAPRLEWALQAHPLIWDALRGDLVADLAPWARYQPPELLVALDRLILPAEIMPTLAALPALLASGEAGAVIVRGPQHNGRRTLLGALARARSCGLLLLSGIGQPDDRRWRAVGPLATVLGAMPALLFDLAPGETAALPPLDGYAGPIGVALGRQGGVSGPPVQGAVTIALDMPDAGARRRHWQAGLGEKAADLDAISARFRMSGGHIRRAARLAQSYAALDGRAAITTADVRLASRALNRQALDTLATPLAAEGNWGLLALGEETARELRNLEARCRHRERLHETVGAALTAQINPGVRALFSGPSGTGKTLAARMLAAALQMDLYRVDLATIVNKYIGETEKNLNRLLAHTEELDVILLFDEGDALLTQRTSVQSSNDRYANLETNYLLQRLESFEGILIVTTNAGERIDSAFQRRMDVVIGFRAPEAAERWAIWQMHLPEGHAVDGSVLEQVAGRCTLTGGQIRNAALHAALLALDGGGAVTSAHLVDAVQREYRKAGSVCPLRLERARGY